MTKFKIYETAFDCRCLQRFHIVATPFALLKAFLEHVRTRQREQKIEGGGVGGGGVRQNDGLKG